VCVFVCVDRNNSVFKLVDLFLQHLVQCYVTRVKPEAIYFSFLQSVVTT